MMEDEAAVLKPIRSLQDAIDRCQALGMRVSRQRRLILELLWERQEHLSAREIYDHLNREGKNIGHTSVYQNLDALASHGIIECIERSDGRLYGNISDSHSHVNCLDSDRILDVYVELPEEIIQQIEAQTGIRITDYRIDFYGYRQTPPSQANASQGETAASHQNQPMPKVAHNHTENSESHSYSVQPFWMPNQPHQTAKNGNAQEHY
jgi:Fur family ferric uptake transcriptional regulator